MGIVNVTPDSFSDGGRHDTTLKAVAHGLQLIASGADCLDIGGESTRPGADPVPLDEELERVVPVIERLSRETDLPLSVDTLKPDVAKAAIEAGAQIWNDVSALSADGAIGLAAELGCHVVLMHMRGQPRTMQIKPDYLDVTADVQAWLLARARAVQQGGVGKDRIVLDPGIGFGKTAAHNLALLAALPELANHGYPVLLGASRKRFIAAIDPTNPSEQDRLGGSLAAALCGAQAGCAMVRVHDVAQTVQALDTHAAIMEAARRGDAKPWA